MNLELNNKHVLVCGSTAGIGKATAIALANEGAIITLIARNEEKLNCLALSLSNLYENFSVPIPSLYSTSGSILFY